MWKAIVKFFRAIDNVLTTIEDYFDFRVKTGKWNGDIRYILENTPKKFFVLMHKIGRARITRLSLLLLLKVWHDLLHISIIAKMATLTTDAYSIVKHFFIEIFLVLQVTFLSFVILFNLFTNSPTVFFISFFPILFFNSLLISALYYLVEEKGEKKSVSIQHALQAAFQVFLKLSTLLSIHVLSSLVVIAAYFIFATFYTYLFIYLRIEWETAFAYWVIVAPFFILLLAILLIFSIITYQSYFILLFERKNLFYSLKKAAGMIKQHYYWFSFFYISLSLAFLYLTYWISLSFYPVGFIITIFFFYQLFLFLGFLLRRDLPYIHPFTSEVMSAENKMSLTFFTVFGITTYIALSILATAKHDLILDLADRTHRQFVISQQLTSYTNNNYHYTIDYPRTWLIQEEKDKSTTLYDNQTKTAPGGVSLNIKAIPFSEVDFNKLYNVRPGLTSYDTLNQNITIKMANLMIQDQYPTIQYNAFKSGTFLNEYTVNYLIHKGDIMYEVSFLTYDKNIQGDNMDLFDRIIDSFKFTD